MTRRKKTEEKSRPGVLITGASGGIGLALAHEFAAGGHDVFLIARSEERLAEAARHIREKHGVAAAFLSCDLTAQDAHDVIHKWVRKQGFSVDILVNNAGFDVYGAVSETAMRDELEMLQVNITALTALTKKFLPRMVKRGRGRIMNIGSTGSLVPTPLNAVYCASKAYVLSFSASLAEECRGTGVTVTCLCPGATHTKFHERAGMEQIKLMKFGVMQAEYVARLGYRSCMAGRRLVVPGPYNKLSMAFMGLLPLSWKVKLAAIFISESNGQNKTGR